MPSDTIIRLSIFFTLLVSMLLWQKLKPRRTPSSHFYQRWPMHLALTLINSMLMKLVFPLGLSALALFFSQHGWGLFNVIALPTVLVIIVSVIFLDCVIYWQHRLFHVVSLLWRLHRMHHSDLEFDTTTALRFHPAEMLISLAIKATVIMAFGIPATAVLIFEIILNALALFNHSNIHLPDKVDILLRRAIVTPDMHRVHHSIIVSESSCNYGFNLSLWDKLFGSYLKDSAAGQKKMIFGLQGCSYEEQKTLWQLLIQPFKNFK